MLVIGKIAVGKTTLINALREDQRQCESETTLLMTTSFDTFQTTREVGDVVLTIKFVDMAGNKSAEDIIR